MEKELILLSEYCKSTNVESDFIMLLESEGLIITEEYDNDVYIDAEQLSDLELFKRLHYDLFINIEGIDVINNLLSRIQEMEQELNILKRRFDFY